MKRTSYSNLENDYEDELDDARPRGAMFIAAMRHGVSELDYLNLAAISLNVSVATPEEKNFMSGRILPTSLSGEWRNTFS